MRGDECVGAGVSGFRRGKQEGDPRGAGHVDAVFPPLINQGGGTLHRHGERRGRACGDGLARCGRTKIEGRTEPDRDWRGRGGAV